MSVFDKMSNTEYVDTMRRFLREARKGFLQETGLATAPLKGRNPAYNQDSLANLETLVNAKAARVDAKDSTLAERIRLARDYAFLTDAEIGRAVGLSREMVRRWAVGLDVPTNLDVLATVLNVPVYWLETGETSVLTASSHLGVRVGAENNEWRMKLHTMTLKVLGDLATEPGDAYVQASLEWAVFYRTNMAEAARKAGGRWQYLQGNLHFVPWIPVVRKERKRLWSDIVEDIIADELAKPQGVARAWNAMQKRCEALGMTEDQYPRKISLFKRVQHERQLEETFGVDLNAMISASVDKYSKATV